MVKKLTSDDWDKIQKEQPSRYYVQSVEDGTVRVEFDSEIVCIEKGDEDSLGNVWGKDWAKNEAQVFINGEPKIYSLGGTTWSLIRQFITVCKSNGITPEDIPGSVFEVTKTGDWEQEIVYIGRGDDSKPTTSTKAIELSENLVQDAKDVVTDLKKNSPDLLKGGILLPDFLKAAAIRGSIKTHDMKKVIPKLEADKIIEIKDDRVFVL